MDREILFRGKRTDNGEWAYGYYFYDIFQDKAFITFGNNCFKIGNYCMSLDRECPNKRILSAFEVIPKTVGQYTGLTDKNGKKIFEGDIVEFDDEVWENYYTSCGNEYDSWEVKNCGVVGFDEDRSCFDFIKYKFTENSVEADLHENHDIEFAEFISELEVIGNIHDNPDLLEVSE